MPRICGAERGLHARSAPCGALRVPLNPAKRLPHLPLDALAQLLGCQHRAVRLPRQDPAHQLLPSSRLQPQFHRTVPSLDQLLGRMPHPFPDVSGYAGGEKQPDARIAVGCLILAVSCSAHTAELRPRPVAPWFALLLLLVLRLVFHFYTRHAL